MPSDLARASYILLGHGGRAGTLARDYRSQLVRVDPTGEFSFSFIVFFILAFRSVSLTKAESCTFERQTTDALDATFYHYFIIVANNDNNNTNNIVHSRNGIPLPCTTEDRVLILLNTCIV